MKPAILVLVFALGSSLAAGHTAGPAATDPENGAEGFLHLTVEVRELGPGESRHHDLATDEGPFQAGWVFIAYGGVQGNASVVVNLTHEGTPVDQWVWTPGEYHKNTTRLQDTGNHELTLWNPSKVDKTRYAFYFDQSCNCVGKQIPLPGGFVIFNYDLPAHKKAYVGLPSIPGWKLHAAVATLDQATANWPDDFQILTQGGVEGRGWLNLTWTTPRTARYFVFVEALEGASIEAPVDLTPLLETQGANAPAPGGVLLSFAVVVAAAAISIRRRG